MYKSPAELALMQRANDIAIVAYKATRDSMREGMTQDEFSGNCSAAFRALGVQGGVFCQLWQVHGVSTRQQHAAATEGRRRCVDGWRLQR